MLGRAVLKKPGFFLLRTALTDSPQGPPTANRQPSTANRQPSTANRQPSTVNRQPPGTVLTCMMEKLHLDCYPPLLLVHMYSKNGLQSETCVVHGLLAGCGGPRVRQAPSPRLLCAMARWCSGGVRSLNGCVVGMKGHRMAWKVLRGASLASLFRSGAWPRGALSEHTGHPSQR